ncbi:MAG: DUF885 family protein, partial [Phenylobacterium sp.]|nr:DUF885 family protein [Phenylobacterium sp.]
IGPALEVRLAQAQASAAKGVRAPRFAYDQAAGEVRRLTTGAPFDGGADSALFADAKAKAGRLRAAGKIDAAGEAAAVKAVAEAMTGSMKPAYDRLGAWLASDRGQASALPQGAGALPDGAAYYQAMLRQQTTTDMTADQIHALGLSEVARIRAEMETLKARIGFSGSLEDFFVHLRSDDRFSVSNDEAGRHDQLGDPPLLRHAGPGDLLHGGAGADIGAAGAGAGGPGGALRPAGVPRPGAGGRRPAAAGAGDAGPALGDGAKGVGGGRPKRHRCSRLAAASGRHVAEMRVFSTA